ncbi:MAG: hypothetical protein HQL14_00720 [Candidatus Omnitrophica bacterium]|nr:hypothetical protein [Candidatus Omnitrophota bacterium]
MVKEKNKNSELQGLLKAISYKTGFLCKKVVELGRVAEKKPLKSVVVATQDICDSFGEKAEVVLDQVTKTVEKSTREIRQSFRAGMDSVSEGHVQSKPKVAQAVVLPKKKTVARKGGAKKAVKKVSADPDLEKEIEKATKDVAEI